MGSENVCERCEGAARLCDQQAAIHDKTWECDRSYAASECAAAIRSSCTHARPDAERTAKVEALLEEADKRRLNHRCEHEPEEHEALREKQKSRTIPMFETWLAGYEIEDCEAQALIDRLAAALREEVSR